MERQVITDTKGPIGDVGAAFYFDPDTLARGKELGLDGFRFYFLGRGGVLGDCAAPVVTSAFGYFEPGLVAKMWDSARQKVSPATAAAEYRGCAQAFGRKAFAEVDGLDAFCEAAEAVMANTHPAGLALYAGHVDEPLADDLPARAMQLAVALRELRGSAHLLAIVASGLHPAVAHAIRRPSDVTTFGYQEAPSTSDADRASLDAAEELTDRILEPSYASLSDAQAAAFTAGAKAMASALAG
jgi:hypothetical protein